MTTFTLARSTANSGAGADPAGTTIRGDDTTEFFVLGLSDRNGGSEVNHVVTDDNGGTWFKAGGFDNLIGDSAARISMSIWYRRAIETGDDSNFIVRGDDGTSNDKHIQVSVWTPSVAYDFTLEEFAADGSGTADWDGLASGNTADPGGSDLFEIAVAHTRTHTSDIPTTGNMNFTTQTDGTAEDLAGTSQVGSFVAIEASGQASGAKTATINSDGSGNEGICAVLVFSDGGVGGATSFPPYNKNAFIHMIIR